MVMFGARAFELTKIAKPPSPASKPYVFECAAPAACGSGSIRIRLDNTAKLWDPVTLFSTSTQTKMPDVLIGLNAGLSQYRPWGKVLSLSRALDLPLAVTEYSRMGLEDDEEMYHNMVAVTEWTQKSVQSLVRRGLGR
ncbi:hypothetical protein BD410DRAFT_788862 [Rickenella mellea]|uniref:Mitochondrial splicing suppressor 51-like C-terminal domain-containing protein n=1 Tax=Rickenella mellea TaxID=50990 RepID=A0A4Y7Q4D4_9AGAM|nr:hypothetical protein BD410DRAFT_788862 [Rickenella mellea]